MENTYSIPSSVTEFDLFQKNVLPLFKSKEIPYGILALAVTNLLPMEIKWNGLVALCESDSTKGVGATENRNKYQPVYAAAIANVIELYLLNNVNVTPADALTFHIHTPSGKTTPIPAPTSTVVAKVEYREPYAQYYSFTDSVSGKKARPKGVAFVQLNYMIGLVPPVSVNDCTQSVFINRSNNKILFASTDEGKKAFCFGRYVNKNGKLGPWCAMFSAGII